MDLLEACSGGHLARALDLLAKGAYPNGVSHDMSTPLHLAASHADAHPVVAALLAAGADPKALNSTGVSALHVAAERGSRETVSALLAAAPEMALKRSWVLKRLPLDAALSANRYHVAGLLLECGSLPPVGELLASLEDARQQCARECRSLAFPLSLYAPVIARQPLTPAEGARVPTLCPGLGTALPAVLACSEAEAALILRNLRHLPAHECQRLCAAALARSEAEAAQLVAHLPAVDRQRLRTAALCLKRVQRRWRVSLPQQVLRQLLAGVPVSTPPPPCARSLALASHLSHLYCRRS